MLTHNGDPRGDQDSILNYVKWVVARHLEDISVKAKSLPSKKPHNEGERVRSLHLVMATGKCPAPTDVLFVSPTGEIQLSVLWGIHQSHRCPVRSERKI